MVNDAGQLYTMEGVAAGMIMLFTAYLVLGATSVYTPGDTHISDMQLEQVGTDALRMMNTPVNGTVGESQLHNITMHYDEPAFNPSENFNTTFLNYCNNRTGSKADNLHYSAAVTYYDIFNKTTASPPPFASNRNLTGGEHPVRVTEWVIVDKKLPGTNVKQNRTVLVEVFLWRD